MATQYSPKQFIRQIPKLLLQEFFCRRKQLPDLNWDEIKEMDADPIFEAWLALPETARAQVERSFRAVQISLPPKGFRLSLKKVSSTRSI